MTNTLIPSADATNVGQQHISRAMVQNLWFRAGIVLLITGFAGWVTALSLPRGPIAVPHVIVAMAVGFGVGGVAGYVLRSRWAILLAPLAFVLAVELGRIRVVGPTVDRPEFSTTFGPLVLVLGRGFQGLLSCSQ